uniref:Protein kinase domain-containing protein n=1 Tax=Rhodnius prolixus TaxID=13249 RepID=T1HJW7_RHOPR
MKLGDISIANPPMQPNRVTNIKPLLPVDPEDNISDETCNTKAFNFSLPSSTPIQNKKCHSTRVSVESQGIVEEQIIKSKNPGDLSMILEASKERYSNSSSSNGCALRGQSTALQSVTTHQELCYPSNTTQTFLISNVTPRVSISKLIPKFSPLEESIYSISNMMNELNIIENFINEEKKTIYLELSLTEEGDIIYSKTKDLFAMQNLRINEEFTNVSSIKETKFNELVNMTNLSNSPCKYGANKTSEVSLNGFEERSVKCVEKIVKPLISSINPGAQIIFDEFKHHNKPRTRSSYKKNFDNSFIKCNNKLKEIVIEKPDENDENIKSKKKGRVKAQSMLCLKVNDHSLPNRRQSSLELQMVNRKRTDLMKIGVNECDRNTDDTDLKTSNITTRSSTKKISTSSNTNVEMVKLKTVKTNLLKEINQTPPKNHEQVKSKVKTKSKSSSSISQTKKPLGRQNRKKSNKENIVIVPALGGLSIGEASTSSSYFEKLPNEITELDVKFNRGRRRSNRLLNQLKKDIASKGIVYEQDIDPFCPKLLERLLNSINFPQSHHAENYFVSNNSLPQIAKSLQLGNEVYTVAGDIGKGAYARIVKATVKNRMCALKVEKPACKWELYICREIQKRVAASAKTCFMDVKNAYIFNGGSILETEWAQYGTLLNVSNQYKIATGKLLDTPIILHIAIELIDIIDYLHQCNIIHGDIKPDNFVVRSLPSLKETRTCIQLIDFGRSIDMRLLPIGTQFTTVVKTEGFTCCEMKDRRPWTYQTDLFGLLSTVHCLIVGEYMTVEKKDNEWRLHKQLPRTVRKLWDPIFSSLLNIESSDKLPSLVAIKAVLQEALNSKDKFLLTQNYRTLENIFKGK